MSNDNHGMEQAKAQLESIIELVQAYEDEMASDEGDESARQAIEQGPLSVEVRSGWHTPGSEDIDPGQYRIVLCTGGPHVEIRGELNAHCKPETASIMYQDWGTPLTALPVGFSDDEALLSYASVFYFGG